jgi:diaminopimelate decarboxylase
MDHFEYRGGELCCESLGLTVITDRCRTPLYVYSRRTLLDHYDRIERAFAPLSPEICYSVKCCSNLAILRLLRERGAAFDVVSGGELQRVVEIGAEPRRVVFAGVGKADDEIRRALECGIGYFNVESEAELQNIADIAVSLGKSAPVALRVNPDVDPHTHQYTTTGKRETKFGVDLPRVRRMFDEFRGRRGLAMTGVHVHLGSPVNRIDAYVESLQKVLVLIDELRRGGHSIEAINIGGGFGAHYDADEAPPAADYAERIVPLLRGRGLRVLIEPGRSIAANAGVLLARVLYTKTSGDRRFVIVDAAMTDLVRPALYGSFHFAWPVRPQNGQVPPSRSKTLRLDGTQLVDIVGPVCESGDFLAKDRWLPPLERGDLVCVFSAGAYGMSMSSQYNSRPRAAEVLVDGDSFRLIRRRETYDDLVVGERQ